MAATSTTLLSTVNVDLNSGRARSGRIPAGRRHQRHRQRGKQPDDGQQRGQQLPAARRLAVRRRRNDILDGADTDVLLGGIGGDTYLVGVGDTVNETGGSGADTIVASITYNLVSAIGTVEHRRWPWAGAIDGTGNAGQHHHRQ
jgi:hypothetical protein